MSMHARSGALPVVTFALLCLAACSWTRRDASPGEPKKPAGDRFVRLSDAYERGLITHGDWVSLERYELRGAVPASRPDVLETKKEQLAKQLVADQEGLPPDPIEQPGDLLARIWTVFGPPRQGKLDEQFMYSFLDTQRRVVFTVSSWEAGCPRYMLLGTYDGALPPPKVPDAHFRPEIPKTPQYMLGADSSSVGLKNRAEREAAEQRLKESASAFEAFLAAKPLADCALMVKTDFGLFKIGAQDGKVLDGEVPFAEAIDYYMDLVKTHGPSREVPLFHLAEPEWQIYALWTEASPDERASRPSAIVHARNAWQRELEKLSKQIILERDDQIDWQRMWEMLSQDAPLVGLDTPDFRAKLARLRVPPPVPSLDEQEVATLRAALLAKSASPHWSDEFRKERAALDAKNAAQGPAFDPVQILAHLDKSDAPADREAARRVREALSIQATTQVP